MSDKQRAIVTGGTSGIGLAAAREFLKAGYDVSLWARDERRGREAADRLNSEWHPGRATFIACDVSSEDSVAAAVRRFSEENDSVAVLVNAAGILQRTPLAQPDLAAVGKQIDIVLKGTILTTTALAGHLARSGRSVVVNIGSVAGQQPFVGLGAYGAAKAGIAHFTRVAAQELYASGVRVVCVCPGVVKTGLMSAREYETITAATPGRRLQAAEEVGRFIAAVADPGFPSLTGAVIDLDDGVGLFPGNRPTPPLPTRPQPEKPRTPEAAPTPIRVTAPTPEPPARKTAPAAREGDPILAKLAAVFEEVFDVPAAEIHPGTSPDQVSKWDSLGNMRLIMEIEKAFACNLDVNEMMEMTDVAAILKVLRGKVA